MKIWEISGFQIQIKMYKLLTAVFHSGFFYKDSNRSTNIAWNGIRSPIHLVCSRYFQFHNDVEIGFARDREDAFFSSFFHSTKKFKGHVFIICLKDTCVYKTYLCRLMM